MEAKPRPEEKQGSLTPGAGGHAGGLLNVKGQQVEGGAPEIRLGWSSDAARSLEPCSTFQSKLGLGEICQEQLKDATCMESKVVLPLCGRLGGLRENKGAGHRAGLHIPGKMGVLFWHGSQMGGGRAGTKMLR